MDHIERIYRLHHLLGTSRYPVRRVSLESKLECSKLTVLRLIGKLEQQGAHIERIRGDQGVGYRYQADSAFELPGIWFSPAELYALLVTQKLLVQAEPGLLSETLGPLRRKVEEILAQRHLGAGELLKRVRIERIGGRGTGPCFDRVVTALIQRKRLRIGYHSRSRDRDSLRQVSPQRLLRYRDNWYLDAWCHRTKRLLTFSLDRIDAALMLPTPAREVSDEALDRELASAFGIFSGEPRHTAVLRFTPERARWVADETWHPQQQGRVLDDGSYELRLPYAEIPELVMDILKYGADVEVMEPAELRAEVARRHEAAAARYR